MCVYNIGYFPYFLSILTQYFYYSLLKNFSNCFITQISLLIYLYEKLLKKFWKQINCISNYFVTQIFLLIYNYKNLWNIYENKNIVLKWFLSNFQSMFVVGFFLLIYLYKNLVKDLWKQKYCISNCFVTRIFLLIYIDGNLLKNIWK